MSCRVDTTPLLSGCCVVSVYPGHGVRGDAIPATGTHGPAPLYAWLALPGDAADEFRWSITTPPTVGELVIFEDGSYSYTPPPATVNLLDTFDFDAWENGAYLGNARHTITIGSTGGSTVTAAAGVSTAATMVGAGTAATAINAAAGACTSATLVGSAAGNSSTIAAAAGVASAQILVGSSFARASIASASGSSTGITLFSTAAAPVDAGLYTVTAKLRDLTIGAAERRLEVTAVRRRLEIKP